MARFSERNVGGETEFSRTDETVVPGSSWISARRAAGADIANAWANAIDEMRFFVIFEKVSSI